jgi:putative endonuclease
MLSARIPGSFARRDRVESGVTSWFVHLIECTDGSIYTGIAIDVDARYAAHAAGKGARYMRAHPPARLLAAFEYPDRSAATIAEHRIKKLSAQEKRLVVVLAPLSWLREAIRHHLTQSSL